MQEIEDVFNNAPCLESSVFVRDFCKLHKDAIKQSFKHPDFKYYIEDMIDQINADHFKLVESLLRGNNKSKHITNILYSC